MPKRQLIQRSSAKSRQARFDKEVPVLTNRKPLPPSPERSAIRWFGVLRKILMDPSLAEPDDLLWNATSTDHQNHYRLSYHPRSPSTSTPRSSRKVQRRTWNSEPSEEAPYPPSCSP